MSKKERAKPVYRVMPIKRLYELFESRRNVLINPSLWDDPYENFILSSKVREQSGEIVDYGLHKHVYGQCWSFHRASDAMWRLYSDGTGVRIKTTPDKLLSSLYHAGVDKPNMSCGVGKVQYLNRDKLMTVANSTYGDHLITSENLFRSLLVKRLAFRHERELRVLYLDIGERENGRLFSYSLDPHAVVSQIMLDPRTPIAEVAGLKDKIKNRTGFHGDIKRSLLYEIPDFTLEAG